MAARRASETLSNADGAEPAVEEALAFWQANQLLWEVLPPGWWRDLSRYGPAKGVLQRKEYLMWERLKLLDGLRPDAWYVGSHLGERLYYVAKFPSVAIADSAEFGNALYYYKCKGDTWQDIFRLPKFQALRMGADRIVHRGEWQDRVVDVAFGRR